MSRLKKTISALLILAAQLVRGYEPPVFPYAPAAGQPGSTAIADDDPRIMGWAIKVDSIQFGEEVSEDWMNEEKALGPASAIPEGVLVLGRGGEIVLSFEGAIRDGEGDDFAIFENALSDTFLELAFVEVSSDGTHYVRFPNYSVTDSPVGAFGNLQPTYVHGLAGKYRIGFGTPFDLSVLRSAYAAAQKGDDSFSVEFRTQLLSGFDYLDLENIRYVKIIDIPGDGRERDAEGYEIFDPYPTVITSGFDLDAVAVINGGSSLSPSFSEWSADFGLAALPSADFDNDGWSQLMEFIFGSDPVAMNSIPSIGQDIDNSEDGLHLVVEYSRRVLTGDLISIQTSYDLNDWNDWKGVRKTRVDSSRQTGGFVMESVRIPLDETSGDVLFVRILTSSPENQP